MTQGNNSFWFRKGIAEAIIASGKLMTMEVVHMMKRRIIILHFFSDNVEKGVQMAADKRSK